MNAASYSDFKLSYKKLSIYQTESIDELQQVCHEDVDLIIAYGGDGTVHAVGNELMTMSHPPTLAILPGGTCNDIARTLMIPQNLKKAAQTIIQSSNQTIDVASINEQYFINFSGVGLITETSENIDDQLKQALGRISYFISAIQKFQQSETRTFELTIDGETFTEEAVMVLVMNGYFIGTHQFPLPSISIKDELLDVLIIKESNLQTIRDWFSLSYVRDKSENHQIKHLTAKEVKINTENSKEVDMDGEVYLNTPVEVKILPKSLDVIVGENLLEKNKP
ncbi:diacylglycerol/lipid kinase family protein [Piscibacillus salipiscarius]|uniref:diacylglycerol/lipid kinase family protein n=1 Tax=Piscibacillus salipiscarius TaxID=299480 RepID=UPI0034E2DCAD